MIFLTIDIIKEAIQFCINFEIISNLKNILLEYT